MTVSDNTITSESSEAEVHFKILHLDDNDLLRTTTAQLLARFKFDVASFSAFSEMEDWLEQNDSWHAAILDKIMPDIDGLKVAEKLRERGFTQPLIIMTGTSSDTLLQQCSDLGDVRLVIKPIKSKELAQTLRNMCVEYTSSSGLSK